jgi:putative tryptophan/tyrosine transport system substrate-binding protein
MIRDLLAFTLATLVAYLGPNPLNPADAEQPASPQRKVGYLTPWPLTFEKEGLLIFEQTLRAQGYIQGDNISIVYRSAEGRDELLPQLAAQLVGLNIEVCVTAGTPATRAVQHATSTIPIVMLTVLDPVGAGFVSTLSRPGGNITGSSELSEDLIPKRLELIKEAIPKASLIAVLWDPGHPTNALDVERAEAAAQALA